MLHTKFSGGYPNTTTKLKIVLGDVFDFLVEVGEGGFEGLAMLRVGGGLEIIHNSDA